MADGDPLARHGGGGGAAGEKRARAAAFADGATAAAAAAAAEADGLLLLLDGLTPSPAKKVSQRVDQTPACLACSRAGARAELNSRGCWWLIVRVCVSAAELLSSLLFADTHG